MTRDDARKKLADYKRDTTMMFMLIGMVGMTFGTQGEEIAAGLGLPSGSLAVALEAPLKIWMEGSSAYLKVLELALDGKLAETAADLNFFDNNRTIQ